MAIAIQAKNKLEKRIERALDEAIELADLGDQRIPARKIAERVLESETDLMAEAKDVWALERLTWMVGRRRTARWRSQFADDQMVLPDPVFNGLPRTVFLRNGQRPRLDYCVVSETEDHLRLLKERYKHHARITQMEAVVELHKKWAAQEKGITWADAKRREAKERENS